MFKIHFGKDPDVNLFTPGRVNLIGEHTDYNGGMVLPTAISLGLDIALSPRTDKIISVASDKFETSARRSLSDDASDTWSDYAVGAVIFANKIGLLNSGANIAIKTDLPFGAGLSSSAAVIVGILRAARELAKAGLSDTDIAVLARRVENEFIGMPCGIMDQMAVAIARPGQALALNTETLIYELLDLPKTHHMAVIHSGIFRQLNEGRYKIRKEECDEVKAFLGRNDICRLDITEIQRLTDLPETLRRRANHCVGEHQRTMRAIDFLKENDMVKFGRMMIESHISMRDDFDISLPAIDALVKDAVKFGATGARMTGGGFGGCIVACVQNEIFESWCEQLLRRHPDAFLVS